MSIRFKTLGCSGGIGGANHRTTSFLINERVLIDAGTGVADLGLDELAKIERVFLTHAHLDHILSVPLLMDSLAGLDRPPVRVYAPESVIAVLKTHIFNWAIWPDFSVIPSAEKPSFVFEPLEVGVTVCLDDFSIQALPVNHSIPGVAYRVFSEKGSIVFSGDTGPCPELHEILQGLQDLRYLIIECAFPDQERYLADISGHFCPETLAAWMVGLTPDSLYITHLKPLMGEVTMTELSSCLGRFSPQKLSVGMTLKLD